MTTTGPRSDDELLHIIEAFVLRARRVRAHSLGGDDERLQRCADSTFVFEEQEGRTRASTSRPPEETLESLAARVRPLILHVDGIHYETVLNALSEYLYRHGDLEDCRWCKELKLDWRSVDLEHAAPSVISAQWVEGQFTDRAEITDTTLATSWFYGDLVHADQERIEEASAFNIRDRYAAAAVRVCQLAILARDTLSFIEWLTNDGRLPLDWTALSEVPVKVTGQALPGQIYTAPALATAPLSLSEHLSAPWRPITPPETRQAYRVPWGREYEPEPHRRTVSPYEWSSLYVAAKSVNYRVHDWCPLWSLTRNFTDRGTNFCRPHVHAIPAGAS